MGINAIQTRNKWLALLGYLVAVYAVAGITGGMTAHAIPSWYAGLAKPGFNPPNWVFGPVWTALYAMMAVAAWLVEGNRVALRWWWCQLALNAAWSVIFFTLHRPGAALVEIVLLLAAIALTTAHFFRVSRAAGWLLVPYLVWVSYATLLNAAIWRLN